MYILFQIKRFLSIYWKESFLFLKTFFKKNKNTFNLENFRKIKGVPDLNREIEIKLDKQTFDFYDLQPKNEKAFYLKSPLFTIIQNHKNKIFQNLVNVINLLDYKVEIGIELEFYITNNNQNLDIVKELKKVITDVENIEEERGNSQFEIKTKPYTNIIQLVNDYEKIKETLNSFCAKNNLIINYEALPFKEDCGSALQLNISLLDKNNQNLFARKNINGNLVESDLLLSCIAGLLNNLNNNLLLYINNEKSLNRFDLEQNIKIKNLNKYPAPTFVSWGINNRSCAIRVPTPSNIKDFKEYILKDNRHRRIEFRIPSADADLKLVLIAVLTSILNGLENNLIPIEKTSFDVLVNNEGLEIIETDYLILNDIFKIKNNYLFF